MNTTQVLSAIASFDSASKGSRKKLGTQTKAFKKFDDGEKLSNFPTLLKSYQKEIDSLTKRARYAEDNFQKLSTIYNSQASDEKDSSTVSATTVGDEDAKEKILAPWKRKVTKLEIANKRLEQEVKEVEEELMSLKNQDITIRELENKIEELEAAKDSNVQMQVIAHKEKMEEILDRERVKFEDREKEISREIDRAKKAADEAREQQDLAQTELFALRSRVDEDQAGHQADIDMLSEELEAANNRVKIMEHKIQRLRSKGENSGDYDSSKLSTKDILTSQMRLQTELSAKEEEIERLNRKINSGVNGEVRDVFNTAVEIKLANDLKSVFEVLDKNHDGGISMSELKAGLVKMKTGINDLEVNLLWDALNVSHNDLISYADFERFCKSRPTSRRSSTSENGGSIIENNNEDAINKLQIEILELKNELSNRPSKQVYMEAKSKLRTLQLILYNSIEEDEDDDTIVEGSDHSNNNKSMSDLESTMVKKFRSMESSITKYKNSLTNLEKKYIAEQNLTSKFKNDCEEKQKLIDQLEEDLANHDTFASTTPTRTDSVGNADYLRSDKLGTESPQQTAAKSLPSSSSILQKIVDDAPATPTILQHPIGKQTNSRSNQVASSMEDILRGQRNRYRKRVLDLESQASTASQLLQSERRASQQLRADNVKLYEKIKYLQSYDRRQASTSKSRRAISRAPSKNTRDDMLESGSMSEYKRIYEQSVNPFSQFHKQELQQHLETQRNF